MFYASCRRVAANVRVLLQVGYFIMSSTVLQLGFVLLMKLRTFAWLYSSAETTADSDLQPIAHSSSPTCSNTFVEPTPSVKTFHFEIKVRTSLLIKKIRS